MTRVLDILEKQAGRAMSGIPALPIASSPFSPWASRVPILNPNFLLTLGRAGAEQTADRGVQDK